MVAKTIKYPMIITNQAQTMLFEELFSEDTETYLNCTVMESDKEKAAFRAGMNYASLLLAVKCYQFTNAAIPEEDVLAYSDWIKQKDSQESIRDEI